MFKKLLLAACALSCQMLLAVKLQPGIFDANNIFTPSGAIVEFASTQLAQLQSTLINGIVSEPGIIGESIPVDINHDTLDLLRYMMLDASSSSIAPEFNIEHTQRILGETTPEQLLSLMHAIWYLQSTNEQLLGTIAKRYLELQNQISLSNFATHIPFIAACFQSFPTTQQLLDGAVAPYLCLQTLTGHNYGICSVTFSPDGQTLASGSWDNTIKLWRLYNGQYKCFQTLTGHNYGICSVTFSPDAQTLASGSWDRTIKLWQLHNGQYECFQTRQGHHDCVNSIAFSPDGQTLASGSDDGTINLWRLHNDQYECFQTLIEHNGRIYSVTFSPDGQILASGSADQTIKLWRLHNDQYECFQTLTRHNDWIFSVAFSPDGQTLASGSEDKTIKLWRLHNDQYECFQTLTGHNDWINSVTFSPNGQTLASGSHDETIKLWPIRLDYQQQMFLLWSMNNPRKFVHGNEFLDGIFTSLPIQLQNKIMPAVQ